MPRRGRAGYGPRVECLEERLLPSFRAGMEYPFRPDLVQSSVPTFVAAGDFNGDGKQDLAVASAFPDTVSILLGIGKGAFGAPTPFPLSYFASGLVVGDFNGDGKQDIAVAIGSSGGSMLLGNGNGSFRPAVSFAAGAGLYSLAVGDFKGDGKLDLVATDRFNNGVHVLLGNGDGTFQNPLNDAVGFAQSVAVGDFNGDGKQDLAVTHGAFGSYHNGVSVLLGNGDGSFGAAIDYAGGLDFVGVVVGDFNGDGRPDLVVADFGDYYLSPGGVSVFLANGDGTFHSPINYAAGANPTTLIEADFNGNGKPDVAVVDYGGTFGSPGIEVLLGNGKGGFQAFSSYLAGPSPDALVADNFNRDAKPDLAVVDSYNGKVTILLNQGPGTFLTPTTIVAGPDPAAVVAGDFNGDGKQDLAVGDSLGEVAVHLGNGDGSFQAAICSGAGGASALAVGDFNRDGKLDIVTANGPGTGAVFVVLGNGDGSFQPVVSYATGPGPVAVAVGDFNGDGKPDLAVADSGAPFTIGGGVSILLGNGDGTFQPATTYDTGPDFVSVAIGDFNGDGKQDLAAAANSYSTMGVRVFQGKGDGSFGLGGFFAAGADPAAVAVGDFNGDGKPDVAVADSGSYSIPGGLDVLLGNGDATFQVPHRYAKGTKPVSVAAADLNGDGHLDLVAGNGIAGDLTVLQGKGNGNFKPAITYVGGGYGLAIADVNGDGRPDLAVTSGDESIKGAAAVLLNSGTTAQLTPTIPAPSPPPPGVGTAGGVLDLTTSLDHRDPRPGVFTLSSGTQRGPEDAARRIPLAATAHSSRGQLTRNDLDAFFRAGVVLASPFWFQDGLDGTCSVQAPVEQLWPIIR
jgi:hypothetical protein